jgi:hypothetical protein
MDEQLYFVHLCGEAFDGLMTVEDLYRHQIVCTSTHSDSENWAILPESEAM